MNILSNVSLKTLNTFHVDVMANTLCSIDSDKDFTNTKLFEYLDSKNLLVLGGGSNILFTKDFKGNVILVKNLGKKIVSKTDSFFEINIQAGENWDSFVQWSVDNNLMGLHNLAYIPGTVGATPIQNVGAYGVEVKDFITEVEIFNIENRKIQILTNSECDFGYRDSIFKNELKNKVIIKSVTFKLPIFKGHIDEKYLEYPGIKESLKEKDITPKTVYKAIKKIREEKLPKVEEYGSCGSTFKNPQIHISEYKKLLSQFPELPRFETNNPDTVKIPAAYILEKLGWKNRREGQVGTWIHHPLIVTNYGNCSGQEILQFINNIKDDIKSKTNLDLECEINII